MVQMFLIVLLSALSRGVALGLVRETAASSRISFLSASSLVNGHPPSKCASTVYSVGVNAGPLGKFILPGHAIGEAVERECVFAGEAYKEGVMRFECTARGWAFQGHTCKDKVKRSARSQCEYTVHTFTLHGLPGYFTLPLSGLGAVDEHPCEFQGEKYLEGSVRFVCTHDGWKHQRDTCSRPASGRCPPTDFTFKLAGKQAVFDLPRAESNGAWDEKDCALVGKTFVQGAVKFTCADGAWKFMKHTCTEQPEGGCAATTFQLKLGDQQGAFELPNEYKGAVKEQPCDFNGFSYPKGTIKFECMEGVWKHTSHTCLDDIDPTGDRVLAALHARGDLLDELSQPPLPSSKGPVPRQTAAPTAARVPRQTAAPKHTWHTGLFQYVG